MKEKNTMADWDDLIGQLILQGQSVAIGIFDKQGQLLDANESMCFFLDTNPAELKPQNRLVNPAFTQLSFEGSPELVFEGLMTIGNQQTISYDLNAKIFQRTNTVMVYAEVDIVQLFQENEKMSVLNQQVNNLQRQLIKEKMNLQRTLEELKDTQEMLIHSEKMNAMGKLVAGVAHEMNNPISFVYSNMHSLENFLNDLFVVVREFESLVLDKAEEPLKKELDDLMKKNNLSFLQEDLMDLAKESKIGIERVKTIVEDLRRFSRLDEANLKQISLAENLKSTFVLLKSAFAEKNIVFSFQVPDLMIECYPGQLNQAITNMLLNSIQAVGIGGHILLEVIEKDETIVIRIQDDGEGMTEDVQKRMFDPFFTTKPVGSGTGLGLSITYKIIHDLHR